MVDADVVFTISEAGRWLPAEPLVTVQLISGKIAAR